MPLVIVPTPIGNLEDITLRALRVLNEADVIACEDTRRTLRLLNRYSIRKPLLSFHEHNERKRTEELLRRLEAGDLVALVSDAGTPAVSDPGAMLLRACTKGGVAVDVLPGPTAFVPALVLSGFTLDTFSFHGFLPRKGRARREALRLLEEASGTVVLYVSPHRLGRDLEDLAEALGDREAMLARELTKLHQETIRGKLPELSEEMERNPRKGEFVLVIATAPAEINPAEKGQWQQEAQVLRERGLPVSEVVKVVKERYGIPKNAIKKWLLGSKDPEEGETNA
ncbi:MAG: 16S rRNA (cytidine(1402)-2'-O)-methyltransferase [Thermovirgaceae bacterium]